jgi:hypothetical protein
MMAQAGAGPPTKGGGRAKDAPRPGGPGRVPGDGVGGRAGQAGSAAALGGSEDGELSDVQDEKVQ